MLKKSLIQDLIVFLTVPGLEAFSGMSGSYIIPVTAKSNLISKSGWIFNFKIVS
jgi:hypothetical protein